MRNQTIKRIVYSSILLFFVLLSIFLIYRYQQLQMSIKNQISSDLILIDNKYKSITDLNIAYGNTIQKQEDSIIQYKAIILQQEDQIKELSETTQKQTEQITELNTRKSLLNKYQYVVFNDIGERTELTYSQIKTGEELMIEHGLNPDLLFTTIATESMSNPDAYNEISEAAGLGQFLPDTGKFVYEDLLGYEEYDELITPYQPDIAIEMIVAYYSYLYDEHNGSTYNAIKQYCGGDDIRTAEYIDKLNSFALQTGRIIY